jgi:hypothetical protein
MKAQYPLHLALILALAGCGQVATETTAEKEAPPQVAAETELSPHGMQGTIPDDAVSVITKPAAGNAAKSLATPNAKPDVKSGKEISTSQKSGKLLPDSSILPPGSSLNLVTTMLHGFEETRFDINKPDEKSGASESDKKHRNSGSNGCK